MFYVSWKFSLLWLILYEHWCNYRNYYTKLRKYITCNSWLLFRWQHGPLSIIVHKQNIGILGQWTLDTNSSDVQLFLEDDLVVSPYFYIFLKKAISFYYVNRSNYDSRLFGLSLQHQTTVVGRRTGFPIQSMQEELNMTGAPPFFKYQLLGESCSICNMPISKSWNLGTWGAVFFPEHWLAFLNWLETVNIEDLRAACTPGNFISTEWWVQRGHAKMWTPWFIRFAFERGWYSLYTNFPKQEAFAINYREAGLNFNTTRGPMNSLVTKLEPSFHFNFTKDLPIFDFHFAKVEKASLLAFRSSLWHPTYFVNQCYTRAKKSNISTIRITHTLMYKQRNKTSMHIKHVNVHPNHSENIHFQLLKEMQIFLFYGSSKHIVLLEIMTVLFSTLLLAFLWVCFVNRRRMSRKWKQKKRIR